MGITSSVINLENSIKSFICPTNAYTNYSKICWTIKTF